MLGHKRKSGADEFFVLLNFGIKDKEFEMEQGNCIFRLSGKDMIKNNKALLSSYGGMVLKIPKQL